MDEKDQDKDWGNVRFRRRSRYAEGTPEDNASARFTIGIVVFLVVAVAYPWYSYWVQSRLMAHDLNAAAGQLQAQVDAESAQMDRQIAAMGERNRAQARQRRVNAIRVVGASLNRGAPVVIVKLGDASLAEGSGTICRQAASWLGQSMSGVSLRVQRHRGNAPAADAGVIRCPG